MALVRFVLPKEIDLHNCPDVRRQILGEATAAESTVYVECSRVDYIDSKGMAMLFDVGEKLAARGVKLVLDRPSRAMTVWMSVTGLSDQFPVSTV